MIVSSYAFQRNLQGALQNKRDVCESLVKRKKQNILIAIAGTNETSVESQRWSVQGGSTRCQAEDFHITFQLIILAKEAWDQNRDFLHGSLCHGPTHAKTQHSSGKCW